MAVELIFKKKVITSQVPGMASSRDGGGVDLQKKVNALLIHRCWSVSLFMWTSISKPHLACKPIFKVRRRL